MRALGMYSTEVQWLLLACILHTSAGTLVQPVLNMTVVARSTDYIAIGWELTDPNDTVEAYQIVAEDLDNNYRATYEGSANIDLITQRSDVKLHESNTLYNICLKLYLKPEAAIALDLDFVEECQSTTTIPMILQSSIIALSLVGGFFVGCILLGCLTWKCKHAKASRHSYEITETNENGGPLLQKSANSNHQTVGIEA